MEQPIPSSEESAAEAAPQDALDIPPGMRNAELEAVRRRRGTLGVTAAESGAAGYDLQGRLTGLALSGGGIRSATFALGVLQRLASADLLKRFDYLSTVSGGGYIGGALTWLLGRTAEPQALGSGFPYGLRRRRLGGREPGVLRHLRLHGNYLTPGRGVTALSLGAVVLRGILLSFLVWLPLAVALFRGLQWLEDGIAGLAARWEHPPPLVAGWVDLLRADGYPALLALVGAVFAVAAVLYSLATWRPLLRHPYRWRRRFERGVGWLLGPGLLLAGLCSLPLVRDWLAEGAGWAALAGGGLSVAAGIAGGLGSFAGSGAAGRGRVPVGPLAAVASVLVFYGLALVAFDLAARVAAAGPPGAHALLGGVAASLLTGWLVNLNYISIHRYYRDRLMEAFLPRPDTDGTTAAACDADGMTLGDACVENGPYHLINTNLVLVDSDRPRWRKRGGDGFLLSPRYCGSTATGWVPTADYMRRDSLTLPTAIAISGAAANPNTGAGGAGPTRGKLLSLLMALLNVRLGYWVPHPRPDLFGRRSRRQAAANHFRAAWHELSPHGFAEDRDLLQLSDGGHFENLGVYELVRRRVRVIVCCDAAADPGFDFKDLQVLMRRVETDFAARIEFEGEERIERLIPREPDPRQVRARDPQTDAYPVGARFAERGYVRGTVHYPDGGRSTLILVKTAFISGLDLGIRGYQGANRAFPDQSTADQFFDEEQFEAYRQLGWEIADRLVDDRRIDLAGLLRQCA